MPRFKTPSWPDRNKCGEQYGGEVVAGQLVVVGSDAAEVLEATEHRLHHSAVLVAAGVSPDQPLEVAAARNDRNYTLLPPRVIAFGAAGMARGLQSRAAAQGTGELRPSDAAKRDAQPHPAEHPDKPGLCL